MSLLPRPESLTVVVVSSDVAFRRLAGAALSRAGHEVHTAACAPLRLERLVRLRHPQVVVLDVASGMAMPARRRFGDSRAAPAFVLVSNEELPGTADKWGPLDGLVAMVESAVAPPSHLQLVTTDQ